MIRIDPDNPEGRHGSGLVLLALDRPQEAIGPFEKAEELYAKEFSPLVSHSRYGLGLAHALLKECQKAIGYFKLIYSEMKNDPVLNFHFGMCYLSEGNKNIDLARQYLKIAQDAGMKVPESALNEVNMLSSGGLRPYNNSKPKMKIILDETLRGDKRMMAGWLAYALTRGDLAPGNRTLISIS